MPAENPSTGTRPLATSATIFRTPELADAGKIAELVRSTGVLDSNSLYCYLLLCRDFSKTCLVACRGDEIVGFVTAYVPPGRPETVFVWQVGVAESARGQGLAKRLLKSLLLLPSCRGVRNVESTITPSNTASRRLFESLARDLGVVCTIGHGFAASLFGSTGHEDEELFQLGPLPASPMEILGNDGNF